MKPQSYTRPTVNAAPIRAVPPGLATVTEVALKYGLSAEALRGRSQDRLVCRARAEAMKALREQRRSLEWIGNFFGGRSRSTVLRLVNTAENRQQNVAPYMQHPEMAHEVEAQMRRITGLNLAHQVAYKLSIPTWQAIFLGILMEAYPLVKTSEQILEAYEAARERLYQDDPGQVLDAQIRSFSYHIRKAFETMGLPDPVASVRPRGMVLTNEAAVWLSNQFGRPYISVQPVRASA